MLVVVCGMHRSGSTLVWQITRMLLDGRPGLTNPREFPLDQLKSAAQDPSQLVMVKLHYRPVMRLNMFPNKNAKYIFTYRDVRDCVASMYRKGSAAYRRKVRQPEDAAAMATTEIRGEDFWLTRKDHWVGQYEKFRDGVPTLIRSLAMYLDVEVDDARVAEIAAEVAVEKQIARVAEMAKNGVDDDLRITSHHITDGRAGAWQETLTLAEAEAIEVVAAEWMLGHGYEFATDAGRAAAQTLA